MAGIRKAKGPVRTPRRVISDEVSSKARELKVQSPSVQKAQDSLALVVGALNTGGFDIMGPALPYRAIDSAQAARVVDVFVDNLNVGSEKILLSRLNGLAKLASSTNASTTELAPEVRGQLCNTFGPIGDLFFLEGKDELSARRPAIKAQAELIRDFGTALSSASSTKELVQLSKAYASAPMPNVFRNKLMKSLMDKATKTDSTPFAAAATMFEEHAALNPAYKRDEIGREFHIVCLNKAGKIDESVAAARTYIQELTGKADFKPDLKNVEGAPINGEVLATLGKAFKVAGETVESGGKLSQNMKEQILEESGLDPQNPPADFDFAAAALDVSTRYYEAGFAKDFNYYPGVVSVYNHLEMGNEKRAMALAPLVWESCQAAGGKDALDYWCLGTQVELGLILGKDEAVAEVLPKMLSRANKGWEISATVDKMSRLLSQRQAEGSDTKNLAFVVDKLTERMDMLEGFEGKSGDEINTLSAQWLKSTGSEIQEHFKIKPVRVDAETKLRKEVTDKLFSSSGDFAAMTASHAVGGNVQYGGQITDMTISRQTVRVVEHYLEKKGLTKIDNFAEFDVAINQSLNGLLRLETDEGARPMEDLHSPEHKKLLDPFDQNKVKVLECETSGDSRTDILAILGFGIGDCRPTGFAKQLFCDVWKKSRHDLKMRSAFDAALSGDQKGASEALAGARDIDKVKIRTMTARIDAPRQMTEMYKANNDDETGLPQKTADGSYQAVENHTFNIAFELDDEGLLTPDSLRMADGFYQQEYDFKDRALDPNSILSEHGFEGNMMGPTFSDGTDIPIRLIPEPYSGALLKEFDTGSTDFMVGGHAVAPATFSSITEGHDRLFDVGQFFT